MAGNIGSFKHSFARTPREKLLSTRKNYSELGFVEDYNLGEDESFRSRFREKFIKFKCDVESGVSKAYKMGRSDPRKVVFAAKMGLALVIVSLLIFFREPLSYIGQQSIWAILTVVVVFEFSIGI